MTRPPLRLGARGRLARWLRIAAARLDDRRRPPPLDPRLLAAWQRDQQAPTRQLVYLDRRHRTGGPA